MAKKKCLWACDVTADSVTVVTVRGITVRVMAQRIISAFVPGVTAFRSFRVWKFAFQFPNCLWSTIGENTKRISLFAKMIAER